MKLLTAAGLATILVSTGCKTLERETQQIPWKQQQAYLKRVQDPRVYGLSIYDTPNGPQIRGGGRLHPERSESLEMLAEEPPRPLVYLDGHFGERWPVLLDCTSPATWLEYELADRLRARPVGERKASVVKTPEDEIPAALSMVSSLRLGQMFIEYPLVYVRMATGSLGAMNRDVSEGPVRAVIGWDLLKNFDWIQFHYTAQAVILRTTTETYTPNPERVVATLPLLKDLKRCAVQGLVNGTPTPVWIDPAGDFEVSAGISITSLQLGEGIILKDPECVPAAGAVRVGARMLQNYQLTICPKAGVIHFERADLPSDQ